MATTEGLSDTFFAATSMRVDELRPKDLDNLSSGVVAALHIKGFLPLSLCRSTLEKIDSEDFAIEEYDRDRVDPPIARFGPVINDFKIDGAIGTSYWPAAVSARNAWRAVITEGADPVRAALGRLQLAWPGSVRAAEVGGRSLFAGAVRQIDRGALIHFDDVRREYGPELIDGGPPIVQLAFNAWISTSSEGGETTIWRRRWRPGDQRWRQGYGFAPAIVNGTPSLQVRAEAGDALLFDPRNYHAVSPAVGGRRIAIAFFIGLSGRGELLVWS